MTEPVQQPARSAASIVLMLLLMAAILGGGIFAALHFTQQGHKRRASMRINEPTQRSIAPGMTRAQVEGLIGVPPGNYRGGLFGQHDVHTFVKMPGASTHWKWVGDEGAIIVYADSAGLVVGSTWSPLP